MRSMMSLGYIVDRDKLEKALATITANNHAKVTGGAPIEVWPAENGQPEHWGECWPHYTEAYYCALALYESEKNAGLEQLFKLWTVMDKCGARWDSGLGISGPQNEGVGGRWYMTNPVSWFDLLAISGVWVRSARQETHHCAECAFEHRSARESSAPNRAAARGDRLRSERGLQQAAFEVTRFTGEPMVFDEVITRIPAGTKPKSCLRKRKRPGLRKAGMETRRSKWLRHSEAACYTWQGWG